MLGRIVVYAAVVIAAAALAVVVKTEFNIDSRAAVLCVYGVVFLALSFAPASWSLPAIRYLALTGKATEAEFVRQFLRTLGAILCFIGLLIISFTY